MNAEHQNGQHSVLLLRAERRKIRQPVFLILMLESGDKKRNMSHQWSLGMQSTKMGSTPSCPFGPEEVVWRHNTNITHSLSYGSSECEGKGNKRNISESPFGQFKIIWSIVHTSQNLVVLIIVVWMQSTKMGSIPSGPFGQERLVWRHRKTGTENGQHSVWPLRAGKTGEEN